MSGSREIPRKNLYGAQRAKRLDQRVSAVDSVHSYICALKNRPCRCAALRTLEAQRQQLEATPLSLDDRLIYLEVLRKRVDEL